MSSFSQFGKLPIELQLRVWSFSLDPHRIIPRIIEADYDSNNFPHKYKSQPPPLTQTCRASREVALKNYSVLNPSAANEVGAIYFHPAVDVLYYYPSCQLSAHQNFCSLATTSFLDPKLPTHLIQHIMFTQSYLTHRARDSFLCPIPELRHFGNIKTLYIALPSHAELEVEARIWYKQLMRFTPDFEPPLHPHITASYAREKLEEATGRRDVVPGYTLLAEDKGSLRKHQVTSCFGWQEGGVKGAWVCGDGPGRNGGEIRKGEDWLGRELPAVRYLRAVPKE